MKYRYIDLDNPTDLIDGVIVRKLTIHKDESGMLVETLRTDWQDVIDQNSPFAMQYMSITPHGLARDENKWHVHQNQKDRFICVSGRIITAVYDPREISKTHRKLNLFKMGPQNEKEMYMVIIPEQTLHGFMVVSTEPGYLLNFPTQLYNPADEGRVDHGQEFNWQNVRDDFAL